MVASGTFWGRSGRRAMAWLGAVVCLAMAEPSLARTWRVERDGSGDFSTVQDALNSAASGDSILIGPGRYTECESVILPGWGWPIDVYAYVRTDNLTIIGSGSNSTIIGPMVQDFHDFGPKGIVADDVWVTDLRVIDVGAENLFDGIYRNHGHAEFQYLGFLDCEHGITAAAEKGVLIELCTFLSVINDGVICWSPTRNAVVTRCEFNHCGTAVSFDSAVDCNVTECNINDGIVGIQYSNNSNGIVDGCILKDIRNVAIDIALASSAVLTNNVVSGSDADLYLSTNSYASGHGNIFLGGGYSTILISGSDVGLHENHIMNGGAYSIKLSVFLNAPVRTIDMRDNYWGTSDGATISEWIWDYHDDPSIYALVDYEPFSSVPLGTEQKSWGGVKNLYR
jgi:hypothetical protein